MPLLCNVLLATFLGPFACLVVSITEFGFMRSNLKSHIGTGLVKVLWCRCRMITVMKTESAVVPITEDRYTAVDRQKIIISLLIKQEFVF